MKKNSRRYQFTLSILWLFTIGYTSVFLMKKQTLPFAEWIGAVYEPIFQLFFGGNS